MIAVQAVCSSCGREAPRDPERLASWRHGEFALEADGELEEGLLLCPECDAEDREHEFEEGEGD